MKTPLRLCSIIPEQDIDDYIDEIEANDGVTPPVTKSRFFISFLRAIGFNEDEEEEDEKPKVVENRIAVGEDKGGSGWISWAENMDEAMSFEPTEADYAMFETPDARDATKGSNRGITVPKRNAGQALAALEKAKKKAAAGGGGEKKAGESSLGAPRRTTMLSEDTNETKDSGEGKQAGKKSAPSKASAASGTEDDDDAPEEKRFNILTRIVAFFQALRSRGPEGAEWEERIEIEFKDVDVAGTGAIAVQGELDRLLARVNGGRTIPPQEKSKLMPLIGKDARITCEKLTECIKKVIEDSPEFEGLLGVANANTALALPPNANPLVLSPVSRGLVAWNLWILFVSTYLLFEVPFHIAFRPVQTEGFSYLYFSEAMDAMLVVDLILHFFTAYVNKKSLLVYDLPHIAKHYLGTTFPLDFAAAFPLDLVVRKIQAQISSQSVNPPSAAAPGPLASDTRVASPLHIPPLQPCALLTSLCPFTRPARFGPGRLHSATITPGRSWPGSA